MTSLLSFPSKICLMIAIAIDMISGMVAIVDRKVDSHQRSHEM